MAVLYETIEGIEQFLKARAEVLSVSTQACTLQQLAPEWEVSHGMLRSEEGAFFLRGVDIQSSRHGEVTRRKQPLIVEVGEVIVLVTKSKPAYVFEDDDPRCDTFVLVRARAEPGNSILVHRGLLLSPPLRFSQAELRKNPEKIPLVGLVLDSNGKLKIKTEPAPQDGARFFEKQNSYGRLSTRHLEDPDVDAAVSALGAVGDDFAWIPTHVLRGACRLGWVDCHLRGAMSLLD